jgi:hypothetical protein
LPERLLWPTICSFESWLKALRTAIMMNDKRQRTAKAIDSKPDSAIPAPRTAPLVFISHDTRDADLAEAFGNLLTDASGGMLQSFRSSDRRGTAGIEFGAEWYKAIMTSLDQATDVVALLTPYSLNRPWILYESGVAKGKLNTTVLGVAIGVKLENANIGPFAQFQNCGEDVESLTKLVLQLIKRNPSAVPREEAVKRQVEAFTSTVQPILTSRENSEDGADTQSEGSSVAQMFEEVKVLVNDLPARLEARMGEHHQLKRSKRPRHMHPLMYERLLHSSTLREDSPTVGLLLLGSMVRDDYPWFYELALDYHRAVQGGHEDQIQRARQTLLSTTEMMMRDGLLEPANQEEHEMFFMVMHFLERFESQVGRQKRVNKRGHPKEGPSN